VVDVLRTPAGLTSHRPAVRAVLNCRPLPPLATSEMMLVWRKGNIEKKTVSVLQYYCVYYCNGAQRYEQFLQVCRLYRALILLGLAVCLPSASVSSFFMVLCAK